MAAQLLDGNRTPVAFGRLAVPKLFEELQHTESSSRTRALNSLCDLMHDPERLHQIVNGGFLENLKVLLEDEDSLVRTKTCKLLHLLTDHHIGRQALLSSLLLPALSRLLDDFSSSCRRNVHHVLNNLTLLPSGAHTLLSLMPKLMLKLRQNKEDEQEEEDEEVQVLLLSTISSCSRLDPLPALASDGISVLGKTLSRSSPNIRREALAAIMALSECAEGKQQVCDEGVLSAVVGLLEDREVEVQANAAGVIMYTAIITTGKQQCLDLNVIPILLNLVSNKEEEEEEMDEEKRRRRKALTMNSMRALTALAEAPDGRCLLLEHIHLLERRSEDAKEDQDIRRAAQTALRVITWTP